MTQLLSGPADRSCEPPSAVHGHYADPSLLIHEGRYYLYPTTDGYADWGSRQFSVLSSPDLVTWTDHGPILRLGDDVSWASSHAWAPAAVARNGRIYLYFTAEKNIGVASAGAPQGPFTDLGHALVVNGCFDGTAIDPSVFTDDDGTTYLYWGNTVAHGVRLADDMVTFDPAAVVSWRPTQFREAMTVHRRHDVYYASWSVNDTRDANYQVWYATGPGPFGPWTDRGILLEKVDDRGILGTGHHSIINLPGTDDWVIAYHRFAIPGGDGFHREIAFDRLIHTPEGLLQPVLPSSEPLHIPLNPQLESFQER